MCDTEKLMADAKGRIEQLAAANVKAVPANPCELWNGMVAAKMARDDCARSVAVDRLLATREGSDAWQVCCSWDARQPKTIMQNGRQVKTGNWLNNGNGIARRIPRSP
jgi:hypothetical protein